MSDDNNTAPDHSNPSSSPVNDNDNSNPPSGSEELKLYIGNIDYTTDENRLRETFDKFGSITDCFCPMDRASGRPRGFGFVTFANRPDGEKAISEMDNTELDGRMIRVSESRPKEVGGRGSGIGQGGFGGGEFNSSGAAEVKLFVGNLAFETELDTIRELFEKEGKVIDCYMPKDRMTDQPRGFAFVTMPSEDARGAMKNLQGHELDSRTLRIEESMPRRTDVTRNGSGGGRYGGGGAGDRGDTYPPRGGGGGYGDYGGGGGYGDYGGGRDRDDRGGYGRDRGGYGDRGNSDRDSYSRGRDRDDRDRGRDRYDDDRRDHSSSRDDRGSRYDDRSDRRGSYNRDREDRYRSDRDRY